MIDVNYWPNNYKEERKKKHHFVFFPVCCPPSSSSSSFSVRIDVFVVDIDGFGSTVCAIVLFVCARERESEEKKKKQSIH